jgi:hypothetical protein
MKKWLPAIVLLCGLAVAVWFYHTAPPSPPGTGSNATPSQASQDAAVARALASQSSNTVAVITSNFARVQPPPPPRELPSATAGVTLARAGQAFPAEFTNSSPEIALQNMRGAIRQYGSMFGGNPVGTNPEITAQLNGKNPRHINFINADVGMRINGDGELVDPWGTPYFFHQLSAIDMEIRSAGPDKQMWTDDDLVTH